MPATLNWARTLRKLLLKGVHRSRTWETSQREALSSDQAWQLRLLNSPLISNHYVDISEPTWRSRPQSVTRDLVYQSKLKRSSRTNLWTLAQELYSFVHSVILSTIWLYCWTSILERHAWLLGTGSSLSPALADMTKEVWDPYSTNYNTINYKTLLK